MINRTDLLADWAFRETPNPANPLWLDVLLSPRDGGTGYIRLGTASNQNRYFLSPLIDLGEIGEEKGITFDGGVSISSSSYVPALLFFNEDYEFSTYYRNTVRDREISVTVSQNQKYVRLCTEGQYLLDSYIKDTKSGEYWFKGADVNYKGDYDKFLESNLIPDAWKPNSRGDYIGYNFANADSAQTAQRSVWNYPIFRAIGINGVQYSYSIGKLVKLPENVTIDVEFSCGVVDSGLMMRAINPEAGTATYHSANANPRTVSINTATYTHVQLYFLTANYADCYIKDATNNVILWQGAASTE